MYDNAELKPPDDVDGKFSECQPLVTDDMTLVIYLSHDQGSHAADSLYTNSKFVI